MTLDRIWAFPDRRSARALGVNSRKAVGWGFSPQMATPGSSITYETYPGSSGQFKDQVTAQFGKGSDQCPHLALPLGHVWGEAKRVGKQRKRLVQI